MPPSSHLLLVYTPYSVFVCSNGFVYPITEIFKHPWRFFWGKFSTFPHCDFYLVVSYRYPSKKQFLKVLHRTMDCLFL